MASTYSPSLRIELIGSGDQAGTWGTTTNTNLGTLIESAIAGYISVPITTTTPPLVQALTALDGAPDQARNAVIALTGATADFSIFAPPQEKTYIIRNTTAYTATIYNSTVLGNTTAAGEGVAIPTGQQFLVFSTGVNFYTIGAANTPTLTSVSTLTNKRITPRVNVQTTTASPWAWNSDSYDEQCFTALANALTISADAGTPTDGQKTIFRFKDNGTARALTWTTGTNKSFRALGVLLPTTTVINKTLYVGCIYNTADSRWDVLAVSQEA